MTPSHNSNGGDPHNCSQGPRLDGIESGIREVHDTLKQLTTLIINQATSDTKLAALTEAYKETTKDYESRLRAIEKHIAKSLWLERAAWIILAALLTYYFNFNA